MIAKKASGLAAAAVMVAGSFVLGGTMGQNAGASAPAQDAKMDRAEEVRVTGSSVRITPGNNRAARAVCPIGTTVTGGGGQTSDIDIFFTDSYSPSGRVWVIRGTNYGSYTQRLWAYARCI